MHKLIARTTAADPHHAPRWVKVFAIVAALLVVMAIVMLLSGGGHGPGRHLGG